MSRPRQLGSLVGPVTRAALGKKPSALGALLADWSTVVGPDTAAIALPEKLAFPKDRQDSATLTLRVEPSRALELQHDLPRLVERINGHFGYRAIDRIKLVQGKPTPAPAPARPRPTAPADEEAIDGLVAGVDDDDLKQRLAALGRALWSRTAEAKDG
jgi:hypothetical protein